MVASKTNPLRRCEVDPSPSAIRRLTSEIRRGWSVTERTSRHQQAFLAQQRLFRSVAADGC